MEISRHNLLVNQQAGTPPAYQTISKDNADEFLIATSDTKNRGDVVELSDAFIKFREEHKIAGLDNGGLTVTRSDPALEESFKSQRWEWKKAIRHLQPITNADELNFRFAGIERGVGKEVGSVFNREYGDMVRGKAPINMEKQMALWTESFVDDYSGRVKDFEPEQKLIAEEKANLQSDLEKIVADAGIDRNKHPEITIEVGYNGAYSISGIDGEDKQALEEALGNNQQTIVKMVKNAALQASLDLDYVKETDESLGIEMTLIDSYLREKVGYGIDDIDIFGLHMDSVDPNLQELLVADPLLDRQLTRIGMKVRDGFTNTFTAKWSVSSQ